MPTPHSMKPMCETSVNESSRLMSSWATAPMMPTIMVTRPKTCSTPFRFELENSVVCVRMMA